MIWNDLWNDISLNVRNLDFKDFKCFPPKKLLDCDMCITLPYHRIVIFYMIIILSLNV